MTENNQRKSKQAAAEESSREEQRNWRLLDAKTQRLGRLATQAVFYLRGKYRPDFRPHEDKGDVLVIINTDKLQVSGKKYANKVYRRYSGWPGGLKEKTLEQVMEEDSREAVKKAIEGMLPKNKLRAPMLKRLKLYKGEEHPHTSAPFKQ